VPRQIIETGGPGRVAADSRRLIIAVVIGLGVVLAALWAVSTFGPHAAPGVTAPASTR
jgi:hypothetical protein